MFDKIIDFIVLQLDITDRVLLVSESLLSSIEAGDISTIESKTMARDGMISLIQELYEKIDKYCASLPQEELNAERIDIIKSWSVDLNDQLSLINGFDQALISALNSQKTKTTSEIAEIFSNNQKFKGYNLNNLKR